ncbi:MAG: transporter substrate-binding domain-containing protein [Algicola sp.]|nr:transporter substrate-binding domain-containing protein [Algicola sp.]
MIFSINRSSERQQKFKWVGDFLKQNYYFLSLNSRKDIKINHIKDVKGYITGVVRDSFEHQVLKKYGFSSPQNLHVNATQIPLLNSLFERKIDLIFGSKINLLGTMDYIKRNRNDIKLIYQINETPSNVSIAFSKKTDDKTVNHFRQAFAAIKSEGTLDKIMKKWLGTN